MNEVFTNAAVETVMQIVAALALMLISVAGAWLTAKIGQNKQFKNIEAATGQVIEAARLTVQELQQTLVDGWKTMSENGKLTEAQKAQLAEELRIKTLQKLSEPVLALLRASAVDVTAIITGAGEKMVSDINERKQIIGT